MGEGGGSAGFYRASYACEVDGVAGLQGLKDFWGAGMAGLWLIPIVNR